MFYLRSVSLIHSRDLRVSAEALRAEEVLQRQCQTLSTLCPLTNAQDYCASRFFWFYCSSDCWLWLFMEQSHSLPTEMAFSSCSSMNKIKVFQKNVNDTKKVRIVQPGLFCEGIPSWWAGGLADKQSGDVSLRVVGMGMLFLHSFTPSEKSWVFFGWFMMHDSFHGNGEKKLFVLLGSKKLWTLGRSPVSPPMVLNFKICTWTSSVTWELWLGIRCQGHELLPLPRSYARNCSERLLLWHLLKPLLKTPVPRPGPCWALILDLDWTSGRVGKGACKCSGDSIFDCLFACLFVFYVEEDMEKLVGSPGLLGPQLLHWSAPETLESLL